MVAMHRFFVATLSWQVVKSDNVKSDNCLLQVRSGLTASDEELGPCEEVGCEEPMDYQECITDKNTWYHRKEDCLEGWRESQRQRSAESSSPPTTDFLYQYELKNLRQEISRLKAKKQRIMNNYMKKCHSLCNSAQQKCTSLLQVRDNTSAVASGLNWCQEIGCEYGRVHTGDYKGTAVGDMATCETSKRVFEEGYHECIEGWREDLRQHSASSSSTPSGPSVQDLTERVRKLYYEVEIANKKYGKECKQQCKQALSDAFLRCKQA